MTKKSITSTHPFDVLVAAEKAGFKIVIDGTQWTGGGFPGIFPLNPAVSPSRCELVAEARRIADMIDTRVDPPPEGVVYAHDMDTLTAAFAVATAYIESAMKGNGNAKSTDGKPPADQPHDADGDDASSPEPGDGHSDVGSDADGGKGADGSGGRAR